MTQEIDKIKTKLNIQETEQKGTQKGFEFEDYCYDILSKIAKVYGDTVEKTGDETGLIDKKGDCVWTVATSGFKIVIEIKDETTLTLPYIKDQLNGGMENRAAQYGIFISKKTEALPKMIGLFNEYDNNKLVIALGSELEDEPIHEDLIRVAIGYALAKLRHDSGQSNSIDIGEIRAKIRGVEDKLNSFTQIKSKCTSISNDTTKIEEIAEEIKQDIATSIQEIASLVNNNSESDA